MIDQLENLKNEFGALERQLADPDLMSDQDRYRQALQRYHELKSVMEAYDEYAAIRSEIDDTRELAEDPELGAIAREELIGLEERQQHVAERLELLLLPKDQFDEKNVILEVRAAAGGDEASLFAAEISGMYRRYAEQLGLVVEMIDSHGTDVGGLSKLSMEIRGSGAYQSFKFESGVHRVQRVPETETQGRIHTSTVTVAVMPEAEGIDVALSPDDYRVDVFRSSGPGGQSVNTTDSAVRITYRAGTADEIVVTCQDGKSQHKNKEKALTVLKARLLERERARAAAEARENRLVQIGSGDRSEKIRTYNFPQSRVTDHRIGFTTRNLSDVMGGNLGPITAVLSAAEQSRRLESMARATTGVETAGTGGSA